MNVMILRRTATGVLVLLAAVVAGCGVDDRATGFEFVSPGGKTEIFYEGVDRQPVSGLEGDNLMRRGESIGIEDFPGKVVVVNIWGSWCGPCRAEADDLQQVYEQTRGSGVAFLGVNVRDERDAAADFHRNFGITYPSIFDPPGKSLLVLRGYPMSVVPSTIVLDRGRRVAAIFLKSLTADQLRPVVERIAAEAPAPR